SMTVRIAASWLRRSLAAALSALTLATGSPLAAAPQSSPYDPTWAGAPVGNTIHHQYNDQASAQQNGAALKAAVQQLQRGDQLVVAGGTYSVASLFAVSLTGTANAPIRIEAAPGETPRLTRPDASQNVINLGPPNSGPARFLLLRGFEITGGSVGIRVEDCADVWIDNCHVHHTGAVAVQASSHDTARLTITHCDIHHASTVNNLGEGIYLGGNNGSVKTHHSVIARNYLHDLMVGHGEGVELKQGSYGCWIAENIIHDTNYPGILGYGTAGEERNIFEGNIIWATNTNAMQVQGEAIVRNNLVFGGATVGFVSFDHQGAVRDLEVVNNTFVTTTGRAMKLEDWAGRPGMVLAGNALYSQSSEALFVVGNSLAGVTVEGNVVHGPVIGGGTAGYATGNGLEDFADLNWNGTQRDAHPSPASALRGAGSIAHTPAKDLSGATRPSNVSAGAYEAGTYGQYSDNAVSGIHGEPLLTSSTYPLLGSSIEVRLTDAAASQATALFFGPSPGQGTVGHGGRLVTSTSSAGRAAVTIDFPNLPALQGVSFDAFWLCRDSSASGSLSRSQTVRWTLE
ncbi:MAG: right-handed parallel beta-helix repeat-containing protein, partial [Myxococcota bacterium]